MTDEEAAGELMKLTTGERNVWGFFCLLQMNGNIKFFDPVGESFTLWISKGWMTINSHGSSTGAYIEFTKAGQAMRRAWQALDRAEQFL